MFDNGHTLTVPVSAPGRRAARFGGRSAPKWRISEPLRAWHGSCWIIGTGVNPLRRLEMDKFENFAFALGFIATGLLTLVAQVTIV
jgi:hypothetical protein